MRLKSALLIAVVSMSCFALAQNQPPGTRVNGVIDKFEGTTMTIKTQDGQIIAVTVPGDVRIIAAKKASVSDIKAGDFIASAGIEGADGSTHAQEVRIFPEEMRGRGEGHRPMAPDPNVAGNRTMTNANVSSVEPVSRTMTNATVTSTAAKSGSVVVKTQYKGGETEIEIGPDTPITKMTVADQSILTPGASVAVMAQKSDSGLTATGVNVDIK